MCILMWRQIRKRTYPASRCTFELLRANHFEFRVVFSWQSFQPCKDSSQIDSPKYSPLKVSGQVSKGHLELSPLSILSRLGQLGFGVAVQLFRARALPFSVPCTKSRRTVEPTWKLSQQRCLLTDSCANTLTNSKVFRILSKLPTSRIVLLIQSAARFMFGSSVPLFQYD